MKYGILFLIFWSMILSAQTKIIAHRGFWNTNPPNAENSLEALENAQKLNIYGAEFDVRMTRDGKLVVNHDEHISTIEIAANDYSDLKKIRLSNGEKLPTLRKYLRKGAKSNTKLIIEIKPAKTKVLEDEIVSKTIAMVKKSGLGQQAEFISFSQNICTEIKRREPAFVVQYLAGDLSPAELKGLNIDGLDYHYSVLIEKHPQWISEANELGLITNAWTVNDLHIFKRLQEMGIDFVTTNVPDEFQKISQ